MQKIKDIKAKLGKWFWVLLVVVLLTIWRVYVTANKTIPVKQATVSKGEIIESVATSGEVKADKMAALSFQSGGKVAWVNVVAGDHVKKGQAIAGLDTVSLNAAYSQALNNYRNYQAIADNVLDQVKDHSGDETYSQKATRTTAEVNRDNAYDAMVAARNALFNASIYAPFDGIVDTVSPSSPGINVGLGAANYTIVNPDTMYFDAEVEETYLSSVKIGQKVKIFLDAYPEETFVGVVESVGVVAFVSSTGGNAYHIRITLPENTDLRFRVGMGGDSKIIVDVTEETVKVPFTAVVSDSFDYVWVVDSNKVKKVEVKLGKTSFDEVEILSGLEEGQLIVDQPPASLEEGQKVDSQRTL